VLLRHAQQDLACRHSHMCLMAAWQSQHAHDMVLQCFRPVYGCLLAQRIAAPQMGITFIVTALHMGICYLLIYQAQVGCALSTLKKAATTSSHQSIVDLTLSRVLATEL
jgi:hypothetical protein